MSMNVLYRQLRSAAGKQVAMYRLAREWRTLVAESRPRSVAKPPRRLVIIPPDAHTLIGSRGDQAMMTGAVEALREHVPSLQVAVLTASDEADRAAREMGFEPLRAWSEPALLRRVVDAIRDYEPDAVVAFGADMLDGYYSALFSATVLYALGAIACDGVATSVFGFSFNRQPAPVLEPVFAALSPRTRLNVRDRVSLERFRAFTPAPAMLVADVAFLMHPASDTRRLDGIRQWIGARRAAGDRVLGFNMHPQLLRGAAAQRLPALIESAAESLAAVSSSHQVSWLLMAHDFRARGADGLTLEPLEAALVQSHPERVLYPRQALHAAELKAVAAWLDAVVAGRMHLAIATLGQGVPVACLTYQDKFHGLLEHFELPHSLLLTPEEATSADVLTALIERLLGDLLALRESAQRSLGGVQRAAILNIEPLLQHG